MSFLNTINSQNDLKKLNTNQLKVLCEEVREKIIDTVKNNGGHLSSNLGIVETTVAINYVFNLDNDKVFYDVGHQCYAHKLLTNRREQFDTIRKCGGISGFPVSSESKYDCFTSGHAGASIAASLGYCNARDAKNQDFWVVNVIGDGSIINGMAMEALSATAKKPNKYLVVLNDNGMSIAKNNNGLYKALSRATLNKGYVRTKVGTKKILRNSLIAKFLKKVRGATKRLFNPYNFIEKLGFKYVGIVDGNDINKMVAVLKSIKDINAPVFLHVKTVKGKGYEQAESNSSTYHGIGKDLRVSAHTFSDYCGELLCKKVQHDNKILAISAGMTMGTGLYEFSQKYPNNFIDVGITEEFAVTYAGGLALGGLKPVVCIYSTFLQRAYDQIIEDVCMENLPVIFMVDRSGLVGADGKTHQGIYNLSFLRHIPNITILSPTTKNEFEQAFDYALKISSPVAICYPNGTYEENDKLKTETPLPNWSILKEGTELCILANGRRMVEIALDVAEKIGVSTMVINARTVKPLDTKTLNLIKRLKIVTLEDNALLGGFGSAVLEHYSAKNVPVQILNLGVSDNFISHATVSEQLELQGLSAQSILQKALAFYKDV